MIFRIRNGVLLVGAALIGWAGWATYTYFFDTQLPTLHIAGIEPDGYYAGDIACQVAGTKKGDLAIFLDGQPLITSFRFNARTPHPFTIPSKTIANGKHVLKVHLTDATFKKNRVADECTFYVDNVPLQANFVRTEGDYKVFQGRTLHLQFQVNKDIKQAVIHTLDHSYTCFSESKNSNVYECFIPINCEEAPNEYLLTAQLCDKVGNQLNVDTKFQVVLYPFKKQTLNVDANKMEEEKKIGLAMQELERALDELHGRSPQEKLWRGAFCTPIDVARITCEFGTIRTTQEKGRYMHKGIDVVNMPKSVVWAPQDGMLVLKERYAYSGNTVVIDHGFGIFTLFFHLDNFADINVGQKVAKGNPIGTIGKTGYATGYHLHWEMRINNIQVDPMQWTKASF